MRASTRAQLRELLMAMRADQLLAASLAGSLEGLRNVVATALVSEARVKRVAAAREGAGGRDQDVVYVPVTPCRLVETRGTFAGGVPGWRPVHAGPRSAPTRCRAATACA